MSDRYNQYRILYVLYDKHYAHQSNGIKIENLLQEETLKYIDKSIIEGEIGYLDNHKLIKIITPTSSTDSISRITKITSNGIDIVNQVLDKYHIYLKDIQDTVLNGAYNNISALIESISKRRETNFYINKRPTVFKDFLFSTNIFDKLLIPDYARRHKDIDRSISGQHIRNLKQLPVADRINKLEDKNMERKSSFKYDTSTKGASKEQEIQISKSIAGFMNTVGGILFIGIDNVGNILGLKNDYSLVKDNNADGFQLELRNSIGHYLKKTTADIIDVKFHQSNGEEFCEVVVKPSPVPIILYDNAKQEFYVREGNSTKPYSLMQAIEYCMDHFIS